MKKLIELFYLVTVWVTVFSSILLAQQQQDKFIIGADWLNPTYPFPRINYAPLEQNYWDLIQSFGLNYGALNMGRTSWGLTNIWNELNKAADRGITTFLWTYQLDYTKGRRWMYQVEDNYDFGSHSSGFSPITPDVNAEPHWSQIKVNDDAPNFWRLASGQNSAGYAAEDVLDDSLQPDGATYYVKLRIRKTGAQTGSTTPVVKVIIINKTNNLPVEEVIYANQLIRNVWQEKFLFSFYKSAIGPTITEEDFNNNVLVDSLGIIGIEDFVILGDEEYTPYEIKIYWYGQVSCDLDYIAIDDFASHKLHNGDYDSDIQIFVNDYKANPGLGNIKVNDEPSKEYILPMRYTKKKIDMYLSGTGYENKSALAFHPSRWREPKINLNPFQRTQKILLNF